MKNNKTNKVKKLIKQGLILLLIIILFIPVISLNTFATDNINNSNKNEVINTDEIIKGTAPDILELEEGDYITDTVMVVIKQNYSSINKKWSAFDFKNLGILKIEDSFQIKNSKIKSNLVNASQFRNILKIKLKKSGKDEITRVINELLKLDFVLSAEPEYKNTDVTFALSTNDPNYYNTDGTYANNWFLEKISAPKAWEITRGDSNIKIGIADTGIYNNHNDLTNMIYRDLYPNLNEYRFTTNYGYLSYLSYPFSAYNHGTMVAGTAGALGNNNTGSTGIAQNSTLFPVVSSYYYKYGDEDGYAFHEFYEIIEDAINNNIDILNCSFSSNNEAYNNSVNRAAIWNYNGLIIAAAGNDGNNIDNDKAYPASFNFDNIISVGASSYYDTRYKDGTSGKMFNYGAMNVDLFAPGYNIYTTSFELKEGINGLPKELYGVIPGYVADIDGTSFSAPLVAGTAALIWSMRPDFTVYDVKNCILDGVDKIAALDGYCVSGGRLNVYKSLQLAMSGVHRIKNNSSLYLDATTTRPEQKDKKSLTANEINQLWDIIPSTTPGYFRIAPVNDRSICLTAPSMTNGTDCTFTSISANTTNQLWKFNINTDGSYWISPYANSTKALEIENGSSSPKDGKVAQIWTYNSPTVHMTWQLISQKPLFDYNFENWWGLLYSDISNYMFTYRDRYTNYDYNEGAYIPYHENSSTWYSWYFTYSGGYYTVKTAAGDNLYVNLNSNGSTNVYIGKPGVNYTNALADKWIVILCSDGKIRISPVLQPNLALDIKSSLSGALAELYTFYDNVSWCRWRYSTIYRAMPY